jgi:hypothetical protein
MSMTLLTILQFTAAFCAYSVVVLGLPAIVLHHRMKNRRRVERLMMYFLAGNFYVMNLVFLLELLHISRRITLLIGTLLPVFVYFYCFQRNAFIETLQNISKTMRRISKRQLGLKSALLKCLHFLGGNLRKCLKNAAAHIFTHPLEWLCLAVITASVIRVYGTQIFRYYGYVYSDIPVHMYWINSMEDNDIFVAGVYPFGFHCVIYYLHKVFAIDTYVLMRVFCLVQVIYIHLMLLMLLKLCCKSRYLPYAATLFYVLGDYMVDNTHARFCASLPQEFGMLFIFPAVYFGFQFFEERRKELKAGEIKKKDSLLCLIGFAMSFSMTLAVHFYGTMVAGIFCMGIAVGYLFLLFRRRYFWNILVTGILSVVIAVLPMAAAFVTGTELEGSLRWGLSIMQDSGSEDTDSADEDSTDDEKIENSSDLDSNEENETIITGTSIITDEESEAVTGDRTAVSASESKSIETIVQTVLQKCKNLLNIMYNNVEYWVLKNSLPIFSYILWGCIGGLVLMGLLFMILKEPCYGGMLISTAAAMFFMTALLAANALGLPQLMDGNRSSIYWSYGLPVLLAFAADSVIYLISKLLHCRAFLSLLSFGALAALLVVMYRTDRIRQPMLLQTLETNDAITCLTNIIREETDYTWLICSANDETRMVQNHGWHWETIRFLQGMEDYTADSKVTLDAETVYFYIEKVPLDYTLHYEDSGQTISERGAQYSLPMGSGLGVYEGQNRWIVMSRMYYWAQAFQKLYPNEMTVYMETDNFICYKLEQNTYRLFNLAIDYGYN